WRLQQAQLCIHAEAFEVAIYQLEFLDEQIVRLGLEAWEPSLCIEVSKLLIVCYYRISLKTKETSSTWATKAEQVYARLLCLDLLIALEFHDTMRSMHDV